MTCLPGDFPHPSLPHTSLLGPVEAQASAGAEESPEPRSSMLGPALYVKHRLAWLPVRRHREFPSSHTTLCLLAGICANLCFTWKHESAQVLTQSAVEAREFLVIPVACLFKQGNPGFPFLLRHVLRDTGDVPR